MGLAILVGLCLAMSRDVASAQVFKKPFQKPGTPSKTDPAATGDLLTAPLFPPDTIAKLKLTAEQKPDYDKLVKEFDEQLKKLAAAPAASGTTPPRTKGFKGAKGGPASPATPTAQAISLRAEYEEKVEKLLNDAQKKTLEDIRIAKAGNLFNPGAKK
jgi:hypothetical protein